MSERPNRVISLCSLADLVRAHRDQELVREQLVQHVDGRTVILQVGLERTGVIRPLPEDGRRELVRLELLRADPEQLRWRDRPGWNGARLARLARARAAARATGRPAASPESPPV